MLGQEGAVQLLKARLSKGTALDTNYIFAGGHGQGKCVTGDTLVTTSRGLVPIRSLMGPNQIDPLSVQVVQETAVSTAAYSYRGGVRQTVRLRTKLGFELEGTPNHRIRVMAPDGTIQWKTLGNIQEGDYACIVRRGLFGPGPDLSGFHYEPNPNDRSSKTFTPPQALDESWGRLMGYMVGDGYCRSLESVTIACAEPDVREDILALLRRLGGTATDTPDKRRPGLSSLRCSRKQFRAFLAYLGVGYVGAEDKVIPWAVRASSEAVVCAFLQAYFESDGSVSGGAVEAVTKSRELGRQLQILLASLGIITRRFKKHHVKYGVFWRVRVMGTSVRTFAERVGFVSQRKQAALANLVEQAHAQGKRALTNIYDVVPFQAARLSEFYAGLPSRYRTDELGHFLRARRGGVSCTTSQVKRIATEFAGHLGADHFVHLHEANYAYDPIIEVAAGEAEVFDLNVPEGESFAANGFMNHNTTLARILARAMLCLNLSKDNPEPCNECENCLDILQDSATAFVEQDAASGGTIDNIRSIVEDLPFAVLNASKRIYLFDEAHRMSRDAQDVLLKPLEEKRMVGIFCTTEPEKIRGPIRSRCEEYTIRKVTREDVLVRMNKILDLEGVPHEDDAVLTVIDYSGGHVRDVLNRLEMVAQMGAVDLANVREYLHLSVVSTYYEILLSLSDTKRTVELIEQVCERVGAEEVSAGLAEAAMNSFRLAHGMFADFVYVDKSLAQKVFAAFGNATVKLAEYFLRSRQATKVSLICDILALQSGVPTAAPVVSAPPVQIVAAPVAQAPAPPPVATPSPAAPVAQAPALIQEPKPAPGPRQDVRVDGVGNLGSSDPAAMTELDQKAVPRHMPQRMRSSPATTVNFSAGKSRDLSEVLTVSQWQREFEQSWLTLRGQFG